MVLGELISGGARSDEIAPNDRFGSVVSTASPRRLDDI